MREILFRGKRADNGEWVEGQLLYFRAVVSENELALIVESCEWDNSNEWFNLCKRAKVIPETVGQYTGLKDKNGKRIFEGDIAKNIDGAFLVCWDKTKSAFVMRFLEYPYETLYLEEMWEDSEIIGNIHDNPELMEGATGDA